MNTVIIVDDNPGHRLQAKVIFNQYAVLGAASLPEAQALIYQQLRADVPHPAQHVAIIVDQHIPPGWEGWALCAVLDAEMEQGIIRPAVLIGLSADMTPDRQDKSLLAGCLECWEKPLVPTHQERLNTLLSQDLQQRWSRFSRREERTLLRSVARQALGLTATMMQGIHGMERSQQALTADDVRTLLGVISSSLHLNDEDRCHGQELLNSIGGRVQLKYMLKELPLSSEHSKLLTFLLDERSQHYMMVNLRMTRRKLEALRRDLFEAIALEINKLDG